MIMAILRSISNFIPWIDFKKTLNMKRISFLFLTAIAGLLLWGCYPNGPEYVDDLDVVYTTYSQDYDFASKGTYARPNQIVTDVKIEDGETTYVFMKDVFAEPILQAIDDNMEANGWERIDISQDPDVLVNPAAWSSTTYFYSYWYDWWYGGWYGGWYGWYYPPYYSVSSYTTGTMVITIADPNEESPIGKTEAKWVAAANGLTSGNYDVNRVTRAIDQAFEQSPYLKTN
jgi:hypothetical protein